MTGRAPRRFKPRRWHAAFYDRLMRTEPPRLRALRHRVVAGAAGRVLEIGAGTGASFVHYADVSLVAAAEPDPFMLRRARREAESVDAPIALVQAAAEALPLPDASVDTVLAVLVLCTVQDSAAALAEARRVLRPGGTLRFMEHVRGDGVAGALHDAVAPAWRYFVGGCNPNRRTLAAIEAAGFEVVELERRSLSAGTPLLLGTAVVRGDMASNLRA